MSPIVGWTLLLLLLPIVAIIDFTTMLLPIVAWTTATAVAHSGSNRLYYWSLLLPMVAWTTATIVAHGGNNRLY